MAARISSLVALASLLVAPAVFAGPPPKQHLKQVKLAEAPHHAAPQRSVGSPTAGKLIGGSHLADSDSVRIVPVYVPGDSRWGLEALVGMIEHAAKTIHKQYPDSQLSVGHLSRPGGGEIDRHASHESGRDADIQFYVRDQRGKTIYSDHFVPFKGDGTAPSWPGAQFDDAKNWALVNSIVNDANARVTHIFVASPIRARLLQYAEKIGAPIAARTRAAELMAQPRGALPHDDHFHVRIACPSGSTDLATNKCVEIPLPHHRSSPLAKAAHSGKPKPAAPVAKAAPKPAPPPVKPEDDDKEESKESFLPSLAPTIPGLDTAIIPKPLVDPSKKADPAPAPTPPPALDPIDDPDGVYENH